MDTFLLILESLHRDARRAVRGRPLACGTSWLCGPSSAASQVCGIYTYDEQGKMVRRKPS